MVGVNMTKITKNKQQKKMPKRASRMAGRAPASFGPVSTINTAPVAIGNTLRGSKPVTVQTADGCRVVGRDFAYTMLATPATITGWEVVGGIPLTPAVMASTILRNYCQIYNRFKINKLQVHYITSSPTSQAGDILFYYERDRTAPFPDYTSNNFLPYVLSDSRTVIGPQWTNHTLFIDPVKNFCSTNYGQNDDPNESAQGNVFVFSKTNSANSPGYILLDYDITFKELSIAPRAGIFPITRGIWSPICIGITTTSVTISVTPVAALQLTTGKDVTNTTSALPSGTKGGDVFKCVFQNTAANVLNSWSNVGASSLLMEPDNVDVSVTVDDGFTAYLRVYDTTVGTANTYVGALFPTQAAAMAGTVIAASGARTFLYGVTNASVTWQMSCLISLVYSSNSTFNQNAY